MAGNTAVRGPIQRDPGQREVLRENLVHLAGEIDILSAKVQNTTQEVDRVTTNEMIDGLGRLAEIMEKAEFRDWSAWCKHAAEELMQRREVVAIVHTNYVDGMSVSAFWDKSLAKKTLEARLDDCLEMLEDQGYEDAPDKMIQSEIDVLSRDVVLRDGIMYPRTMKSIAAYYPRLWAKYGEKMPAADYWVDLNDPFILMLLEEGMRTDLERVHNTLPAGNDQPLVLQKYGETYPIRVRVNTYASYNNLAIERDALIDGVWHDWDMLQKLCDEPRAVVVDIGGFTADYLQIKFGEAQLSACDSLENGVIHLYNRVLSKINAEFDLRLEESDVDAILERRGGYEPALAEVVERQAASFVGDLFGTLRERGIDLRSGLTVFSGGGAILLRRFIEETGKVGRGLFVTDINANAKGFERLYQATRQGA